MKNYYFIVISMLLIFSCEKDNSIDKNSKLKVMYIYSGSTANTPYSFTTYSYDNNWNLKKELISNYPSPVYASNTYEYSVDGQLINEKRMAIEGENHPDQTESDFSLFWENKYEYTGNKKIEKVYCNFEMTDSNVYTYNGDLLVVEYHYNIKETEEWSIEYEYYPDNNLKKEMDFPGGTYSIYLYDNSKLLKIQSYDKNNTLLNESVYSYTTLNGKEICEVRYGEFLSDKYTSVNGAVVEHIKYHPTFQGAEWWCKRYTYY